MKRKTIILMTGILASALVTAEAVLAADNPTWTYTASGDPSAYTSFSAANTTFTTSTWTYKASSNDAGVSGLVVKEDTLEGSKDYLYVAVSSTNQQDANQQDIIDSIVKFSADGKQVVWVRPFDANSPKSEVKALAKDSQGNIIVAGTSWSPNPRRSDSDCRTIKLSPQGVNLWWGEELNKNEELELMPGRMENVNFNGPNTDQACAAVVVDKDDNVYVGGKTLISGLDTKSYNLLVKYDKDRQQTPVVSYSKPVPYSDWAIEKLAVDNDHGYLYTITWNNPYHWYMYRRLMSNLEPVPLASPLEFHDTTVLRPMDLAVNSTTGRLYLAGYNPNANNYSHKMMSYDLEGWRKCVYRTNFGTDNGFWDSFYGVTLDQSGTAIMVGSDNKQFVAMKVITRPVVPTKYEKNGITEIWEAVPAWTAPLRADSVVLPEKAPNALAMGSDDAIYMIGAGATASGGGTTIQSEVKILKYIKNTDGTYSLAN